MTSLLDLEQKKKYVTLLKKRIWNLENEVYEIEQQIFEEEHGFRNGSVITMDEEFKEKERKWASDSFYLKALNNSAVFTVTYCYTTRDSVEINIDGWRSSTTIEEIERLLNK